MSSDASRNRPHVFMLRLWTEDSEAAATAWRGKVQSLPDGEAYYFRDWEGLRRHLQAMLAVDNFKHLDTQGFVQNIQEDHMSKWYVSLMSNKQRFDAFSYKVKTHATFGVLRQMLMSSLIALILLAQVPQASLVRAQSNLEFGPPQLLGDSNSRFSDMDADGDVVAAVWLGPGTAQNDTDVWMMLSSNKGLAFGSPVNVSSDPTHRSRDARVLVRGDVVHIYWVDQVAPGNPQTGDTIVRARSDNGYTPEVIYTAKRQYVFQLVAAQADIGFQYLAWIEPSGANATIDSCRFYHRNPIWCHNFSSSRFHVWNGHRNRHDGAIERLD